MYVAGQKVVKKTCKRKKAVMRPQTTMVPKTVYEKSEGSVDVPKDIERVRMVAKTVMKPVVRM